jgi:hypothetical protein
MKAPLSLTPCFSGVRGGPDAASNRFNGFPVSPAFQLVRPTTLPQSQRDCITQPRVGPPRALGAVLPWECVVRERPTLKGLCRRPPATDQTPPPHSQLSHSLIEQVPENRRSAAEKKEATDGIRGYSPGNRIVSRTAFRQEVVPKTCHAPTPKASAFGPPSPIRNANQPLEPRFPVPEGQSTIAQRFNVGGIRAESPSPDGTAELGCRKSIPGLAALDSGCPLGRFQAYSPQNEHVRNFESATPVGWQKTSPQARQGMWVFASSPSPICVHPRPLRPTQKRNARFAPGVGPGMLSPEEL